MTVPVPIAEVLPLYGRTFFVTFASRYEPETMIRKTVYRCEGTCSQQIEIETEENIVRRVAFTGGCHGNTQGIAALVRGMRIDEAAARLKGIDCRGRGTSCPDQLARALERMQAPAESGD